MGVVVILVQLMLISYEESYPMSKIIVLNAAYIELVYIKAINVNKEMGNFYIYGKQ